MATTTSSTFASLLKRHRLAAGLTQEALAERAGVSARGVQDLERGVHTPRLDTIQLLVDALELDATSRADLIAAAHPEAAAPAPAATTRPRTPVPLPAPTALVGREREVAEICALLRHADRDAGPRLLTLTGPGGVGKTRLALAVAAELSGDFADGATWVDLAALHDPASVAATVASALDVREDGQQSLSEALAAFVKEQQLLLILDNFEHVLLAAPLVSSLLVAGPHLTVLATSRARLRLRGEREFPVSPLAVPVASSSGEPPLAGLAGVASVRLFIERAAEVRPGFTLSDETAPLIAEICRRLDGLPLAIELAAARAKILPPAALLARLEERLPLLSGGARDLPLRQQTMRDAIAWSYDLLPADEQTLFRRLAVFAGGFSFEGAEWVAGDRLQVLGTTDTSDSASHPATLDLIASLVDQSLLRPMEGPGGEPRFAMLETVRAFGWEQLAAGGELASTRHAHAGYYLTLAEQAEPELTGPDQAAWLERLEAEHANVRAGLEWALAANETEIAQRFAGALWHFWQVRGHVGEGRAWAEAAVDRAGAVPTIARAKALRAAGLLAEYHGDYDHAVARHEAAAAVWRQLGDERNLARTLDHLGNCAHDRGDFARAALLHEEALVLARKVGDVRGTASALGNLGIMAIHMGQLDVARQRLEEALALLRSLDHTHGVALALSNLGVVAVRAGDLDRGITLNEEALSRWQDLGDRDEIATAHINLGDAVRLRGDLERAEALCAEGSQLFAELGNKRGEAAALESLGAIAYERQDDQRAAALFAAGLAISHDVDDKVGIADCLEGLAGAAARLGRAAAAARLLGAATGIREIIGAPVAAHLLSGYESIVAAVRSGMDESAFQSACEHGRAQPLAQIVAKALALADELARRPTPEREASVRSLPRRRGLPSRVTTAGGTNLVG